MSIPVTAEWCGACGSEATGPVCPTCSLPVRGADADELRVCSQTYRHALARGDAAAAEAARARHARARARLVASIVGGPPTPPAPVNDVDDARTSASTLITWVGAALVLAGALAFAGVVWQYAGGPGRIAILVLVTAGALVAADRLRTLAPTTAEASVAIAAGMCLVDAVAAHVAGYVEIDPTGWAALTLLPSGLAFLGLARRWRSRTAAASGIVLVALGTAGLALWPLTWSAVQGVTALTSLVAGIVSAALAIVAGSLRSRTERAAVVVAASTLWIVQLGVSVLTLGAHLVLSPSSIDGWDIVGSLALLSFAALPLTVATRSLVAAPLAGLVAAGTLAIGVAYSLIAIAHVGASDAAAQLASFGCLVLLVLIPTVAGWWSTRAAAGPADAARAGSLAIGSAAAYLLLSILEISSTQTRSGDLRAATLTAALSLSLALPALVLERRVPRWATQSLASAAITGLIGALGLATPTLFAVPTGDVVALASVAAMALSWVVPSLTWQTGARWASLLAIVAAPFLGLTVIENASLPAAVVAAGFGLRLWRNGEHSSWMVEAPAVTLLLAPTLAAGLVGDRTGLRLTAVVVAGAAVLLDAARRHRQGSAVVSVAAIATAIGWVTLPHLSETPSWLALVLAGAVLLWVGFTWERRRDTARHLTQSWSTWQ